MAFDIKGKKTEHNGAKNSGHDKFELRGLLKQASKTERRRIDAAFARMATDEEYWKQALEIEADFADADHEALQLGGIV